MKVKMIDKISNRKLKIKLEYRKKTKKNSLIPLVLTFNAKLLVRIATLMQH